jgi:hypothetical protein
VRLGVCLTPASACHSKPMSSLAPAAHCSATCQWSRAQGTVSCANCSHELATEVVHTEAHPWMSLQVLQQLLRVAAQGRHCLLLHVTWHKTPSRTPRCLYESKRRPCLS